MLIHVPILLTVLLALAPLRGPGAAPQEVGSALGTFELEDLSKTPAKSVDGFYGRLVLIEFFAYW